MSRAGIHKSLEAMSEFKIQKQMSLYDEIAFAHMTLCESKTKPDLLIISKEMERRFYIDGDILKSIDVEDAFDIEVIVVDKLDKFRLLKEL